MRALITGANGFIGQHLVAALTAADWHVRAVDRHTDPATPNPYERVYASLELDVEDLADVDCVFHLAGLAHDNAQHARSTEMRAVNVDATLALFSNAAIAGVRRFVHLSSIKVLGEHSIVPLAPNAVIRPEGAYALSKAQAEQGLTEAAVTGAAPSLMIVRPPLVYGPGVKANFLALMRWAASGWPLPLGGATAPRAWVSVANLVDLLHQLGNAEFGGSHIVHVADAEQSSVRDMLGQMRRLLGQPERLWDVSAGVAVRVMHLLGRADLANKLFAPLEVDFSSTTRLVGWSPPNSQEEELKKVLAWFQT